jgi:nicotinate-nucleotide--dimethylbenzimidazole phosphoribosyltransferase
VLLDGFIGAAAALAACAIEPRAADWMLASHRSAEQGHGIALARLGLAPLLDLGLRLGEGSGAALAVPLVQAALALHRDMATFADAGVSDRAP